MTIAGWSPEDYYLASRAARAAWQATDQQLTLTAEGTGVDGTDPGTPGVRQRGTAVPAPSPSAVSVISDSPALALLGLETGAAKRAASYGNDGNRPAAAAAPVSSPPVDASLSRRAGSNPSTGEEPV